MQDISKELKALVPADKAEQTSLLRALMMEPKHGDVNEAFDIITGTKQ
jgi:hypothetical protein